MKKITALSFFTILSIILTFKVHAIAITPYVPSEYSSILNVNDRNMLKNKLEAIIRAAGDFSSPNSRFVLVPRLSVIDEVTTSSIPSQTIVKINITYCVGDGIDGTLYDTVSLNYKGVGDDKPQALHSAISKINPESYDLKRLISDIQARVIQYYNTNGQEIIDKARAAASQSNYEQAISLLQTFPNGCKDYDSAQKEILTYGSKILARDNTEYLTKAKAAWAASPNPSGAREAKRYINMIVVTDPNVQKEVNTLISTINRGMSEHEKNQINLQMKQIESETAIRVAEKDANARIISTVVSSSSSLIYNIARWLFF